MAKKKKKDQLFIFVVPTERVQCGGGGRRRLKNISKQSDQNSNDFMSPVNKGF